MSAKPIELQPGIMPPGAMPMDKLVHLALPVRLTHMQNGERGGPEMACTYDIHPRGARLLSFRGVKVGDLITVERGRNKSICQVVWTADPASALRGQFTVECVEGARTPWEDELRQMQEQYLPINPDAPKKKTSMNSFGRTDQNRRRHPRFDVEGGADLLEIGGQSSVEGRVEQLSEYGCLVSATNLLVPGTGLRLALNIYDVSVALKGNVRYTAGNRAMGVEFQEIRQGDRPLLDYVLKQVKGRRNKDFADLEVVTVPLAAAAR
ncbi:MAG: PilZ domain-containing protein [Candidatus Sulfotelmatobacter sp.]